MNVRVSSVLVAAGLSIAGWSQTLVTQPAGPTLGYTTVGVKQVDGLWFKNLSGADGLLPFEDWRLAPELRAADLARRLSDAEIAGLMLHTLAVDVDSAGLNAEQTKYLTDNGARHILVGRIGDAATMAQWANNIQAAAEGQGHGVPVVLSSDPRHAGGNDEDFAHSNAGLTSMWSDAMGLAATFDPERVREFGRMASSELRSLGITMTLSPQADLATEPRWYRHIYTFGNDPALVTDMTRAYIEGFEDSVSCMVKHWPGGGTGEGGRDAHYGHGKFAVYPGGCYATHKRLFVDGAFSLINGGQVTAVMPYYTISTGQSSEAVGNAFNREIVTGQLRDSCGFGGIVCGDWVATRDQVDPGTHSGKPWGVETLSVAERHKRMIEAGVDQFGGNWQREPVKEAFALGRRQYGDSAWRGRIEQSAVRLLTNMFKRGLFENPYVDVNRAMAVTGDSAHCAAGYRQQQASVVMLKNRADALPLRRVARIYVPHRHLPRHIDFWGDTVEARTWQPWTSAAGIADADAAVVFMASPMSEGLGYKDGKYVPISLQYRPYTASTARPVSLGRDSAEAVVNRSYRGRTAHAVNECDLDTLVAVRRAMGHRPVIVVMNMANPAVMAEVEPLADAILVGFNVQPSVYLDVIQGEARPSALLPFELPAAMEAIEAHCEDRPHDIAPYRDSEGNTYGFGFGMDFNGVISDWRTDKYVKPVSKPVR